MKIEELFRIPARRALAVKPEMDPLTEDGALMESQLLDVRFEALTSTVILLFDLREALQLRLANTGVLIVHEVARLEWNEDLHAIEREMIQEAVSTAPQHRAWNVIASEPRPTDLFNLNLQFVPGAELNVSGASAEFLMGDVPGIGEVAATYTDDPLDVIEASLPHWDSSFDIRYATFLERKEP